MLKKFKKKILLIGGGGHARVLIDLIQSKKVFSIHGILDPNIKKGKIICGFKVLGDDNELEELQKKGFLNLALGVGSKGNNYLRFKIWKKLISKGFIFPKLIHKNSHISKFALISEGSQIFNQSIINSGSYVGKNSVINNNTVIEHGCNIGSHVFTGTSATVCGDAKIKDLSFLGAKSCVLPEVEIGKEAIIAAGSLVNKDVKGGTRVKGVPAKKF